MIAARGTTSESNWETEETEREREKMNRMKTWDRLLRLARDHHLFFPGAEIIWLSDRGGLDQPSPCIQPYIRCHTAAKTINPSLAWDAHIYHGKWYRYSVNTPVFHQATARRSGWCIAHRTFSVIAQRMRSEKKWQGVVLWVKCSGGRSCLFLPFPLFWL